VNNNNTIEWTPEDIAAEREGAALLRLQRRTGAGMVDGAPAPAPDRPRIRYQRQDAIAAFDRLFYGGETRATLAPTRLDLDRRKARSQRRAADVAAASALRGLSRDQQRAELAKLRGV
jgi:hypothetical protein